MDILTITFGVLMLACAVEFFIKRFSNIAYEATYKIAIDTQPNRPFSHGDGTNGRHGFIYDEQERTRYIYVKGGTLQRLAYLSISQLFSFAMIIGIAHALTYYFVDIQIAEDKAIIAFLLLLMIAFTASRFGENLCQYIKLTSHEILYNLKYMPSVTSKLLSNSVIWGFVSTILLVWLLLVFNIKS